MAERGRRLGARDTVLESSYPLTAEMAPLGLAPNRRVGGRDMELEKARARRSISNTQSVRVVKASVSDNHANLLRDYVFWRRQSDNYQNR